MASRARGEQSGVVELLVEGRDEVHPAADFERAGRERIFSREQDIRVEGFGEGFASDQGRLREVLSDALPGASDRCTSAASVVVRKEGRPVGEFDRFVASVTSDP